MALDSCVNPSHDNDAKVTDVDRRRLTSLAETSMRALMGFKGSAEEEDEDDFIANFDDGDDNNRRPNDDDFSTGDNALASDDNGIFTAGYGDDDDQDPTFDQCLSANIFVLGASLVLYAQGICLGLLLLFLAATFSNGDAQKRVLAAVAGSGYDHGGTCSGTSENMNADCAGFGFTSETPVVVQGYASQGYAVPGYAAPDEGIVATGHRLGIMGNAAQHSKLLPTADTDPLPHGEFLTLLSTTKPLPGEGAMSRFRFLSEVFLATFTLFPGVATFVSWPRWGRLSKQDILVLERDAGVTRPHFLHLSLVVGSIGCLVPGPFALMHAQWSLKLDSAIHGVLQRGESKVLFACWYETDIISPLPNSNTSLLLRAFRCSRNWLPATFVHKQLVIFIW